MTIEFYDVKKDAHKEFNILDYISGTPDKDTDYSAQFTQAQADATAAGGYVYIPAGEYGILTTVNITAPTVGTPTNYRWEFQTRLNPLMSDGTAVVQMADQVGLLLENISVRADYLTPSESPENAVNCIAFDLGYIESDPETRAVRTTVFRNLTVYGCKVGFQHTGWICSMENLLCYYCQEGFKFYTVHANVMTLDCESCAKGYSLYDMQGNSIGRMSEEGVYGASASTLNRVSGLSIAQYRTEGPDRAVPWLEIGKTEACSGITISGAYITAVTDPRFPIELDDVTGFSLSGHVAAVSGKQAVISRTAKTRGDSSNFASPAASWCANNSAQIGQVSNLFPNSKMSGAKWLAQPLPTRVTVSEETANTVHGRAVMLTPGVTAANCSLALWIETPAILAAAAGKQLTMGAWVYVPDVGEYSAGGAAVPAIVVYAEDSGGAGTQGVSTTGVIKPGQWSFVTAICDVQAVPTRISAAFWPDRTSTVQNQGEYMIVGAAVLASGDARFEISAGSWEDGPLCATEYCGNNMTFYDTQAQVTWLKSRATNAWEVGDKLIYTDPAAGGHIGEVCTVAGAGSGATWNTFGAVTS